MKTILAQLKKDIAICGPLLWVWVVCVAVDSLCFLDRIGPTHISDKKVLSVLVLSLLAVMTSVLASFVIQLLLLMVLVIQVIHADSLVDPNAFWRTRPIARSALLTEKALFVVLLLAGTLLAASAIHFQSGSSGRAEQLLHFVVFVAGLVAFSAVTSNFAKLILTAVVITIATGVVTSVIVNLTRSILLLYSNHSHYAASGYYSGNSAPAVVSAIYLAGFVAVIVWQYLTLRTNVSRAILCLTFFLGTLLAGK